MKNYFPFRLFLLIFLFMGTVSQSYGQSHDRKISFDQDWKFHRGSIANAEQENFNDKQWRTVDIPHDWSMDPAPIQKEGITAGPFSKYNEGGAGGADIGQTLGGEGWYRKQFTIGKEDSNKRFALYIEGAINQSEVYVNGKKVYFNPYGYISYKVDITDYCNPTGASNTIAIRVLNVGENSRWYSGSGLYRHVWLIKTEKVYLDEWDTFVSLGSLKNKDAKINLSTIIHNETSLETETDLQIEIISPEGKKVSETSKVVRVGKANKQKTDIELSVPKAQLWSIENPQLYEARLTLKHNGRTEKITIPFGIRTIEFSAEKGFLLNGKPLKLKGGCLHHDNGLLGAAAIDRAEARKVELMKANGYNAVRCAHNPPSEHFLTTCDRLGMLVIDESFDQWQRPKRNNDYHQYFDEWSDNDLASIVRRDRNHPSIIMWSIGNEIADRASDEGIKIAQRLRKTVEKYDTTRFITAGVNEFWDNRHLNWDDSEKAFRHLDVAGYNYMWKEYENDHKKHPKRIMYGSESVPKEAHINWNLVEKNPYIIGDFVWTSLDYLGEAGLAHSLELGEGEWSPQFMGWPWYNAWCGDIDFCGDKKPQSFYRDILWREREISMAVQPPVTNGKREDVNFWGWRNELLSWNWPGNEGKEMTIRIYSRSPKVRLYQDGTLIGEKETGKEDYTATFNVVYKPGILKAVNVEKKKEKASFELKTTGKPVAIRLTADRQTINADKNDLSFIKIDLIDAEGNVVPDSDQTINIQCEGDGSIIASGNAAPDDMKSFRSMKPKTFRGKAIAIVQPNGDKSGEIKLTASAEGLKDGKIIVKTTAKDRFWNKAKSHIPLDSIRLSDPAILADKKTDMYYMTGTGGMLWKSKDLKFWEGPFRVVEHDKNSWMGERPQIWAAELHEYKGKYYYFATFTNNKITADTVNGRPLERRACHVLVSDKPDGPYVPMKDETYLPANMLTLDGTFWIDKNKKPYMIFCHEWLQNNNGTMEKIELKKDLSGTIGQSTILFKASDSPWSRERINNQVLPNRVTDGPYLFRTQTGKLGMIWTSWIYDVYTQGVAYSQSGTLDGPWIQEEEPITPPNFGHGMLFQNLEGKWLMSVHSHKNINGHYLRIPNLFEIDLSGDKLVIGNRYTP